MSEKLTLNRQQADQIISQALEGSPREVCGILGGKGGVTELVLPATNINEGNTTYTIDPKEQFDIMRRLRDEGLDLIGIYHSHPATVAYPSATDKKLAFYPDAFYVIISLAESEADIRVFRIVEDVVDEVELEIV